MTLWAGDNDDTKNVCLTLVRAEVKAGIPTPATAICSTGADSYVRRFSDRTFRPRTGRTTTSFYLWLDLPTNVAFFGATIDWRET